MHVLDRLQQSAIETLRTATWAGTRGYDPALLMACNGDLVIVEIPREALATDEDKKHLAEVFLPRAVRENGADAVALVTEAWVKQFDMNTNDGFGEYLKAQAEGLSADNAEEYVVVELISPELAYAMQAKMTRKDGSIELGDFVKAPKEINSRYTAPLQMAMSREN
jgi:hypothetical protein